MKVILPALRFISKTKQGNIVSEILRKKYLDTDISVIRENQKNYYIIKNEGREILLETSKSPKRILSKYQYILSNHARDVNTREGTELDLSNFQWIRHPLLDQKYLAGHNKEFVSNSWTNAFRYQIEKENEKGLRIPQIGALHAIQAHWSVSNEPGIIVLPTGVGKTETMLSTLIIGAVKALLVIVPTDALRDQLSEKFISLGILPEFGIVSDSCENPIVGIIKHSFLKEGEVDDFFSKINVAVATMNVISFCESNIQDQIAKNCSHLFIDEAHHTPADTWRSFKERFKNNKLLLFTATPFRNDGKILQGKIIFNFPLRKAQELGYFQPIHFKPIHEYEYRLADSQIADLAVRQLQEDLKLGFDHILMVRVNSIDRGKEIFPLYSKHIELKPVLVHSAIKPKKELKEILNNIVLKKHRIIICVDMLGEGFDLPELKIAAFHDTKKSLAITLQLAGRFTRSKPNLGPATFIANIADPEVHEDLEGLYYRDSDWNILLPDMSYQMSMDQEDFRTFLEGFKGFPEKFPIQSIKHPLSTIIFQAPSDKWKPLNYRKGIKGVDNFDYTYADYNKEREILVIILGKRTIVKWARVQDFESVDWNIIICFFDKESNLLYLHASDTSSYYLPFVQAICIDSELLKGEMVFRCFSDITRIRLHNVGVREPMGRAINYIMRVGSDIKTALRDTEIKKAIKSNIFGVGFENGSRVSIGCSHHGRIWSMRTNNILVWIGWCKSIAKKITDPAIDPDLVLKGTLIPQDISAVPEELAFAIEWPDIIYRQSIGSFYIEYKNESYAIWNCDIVLKSQTNSEINFQILLPSGSHDFSIQLIQEEKTSSFRINSVDEIYLVDGNKKLDIASFFLNYPPLIYFIDGSFLEGNLYTKIHSVIPQFSVDNFELLEWTAVNIKKESQTYLKFSDSIQFYLIQKLLNENKYSIIMDDDDKGEISDVVAFRIFEEQKLLIIELYHCKYSSDVIPGARLKDFYEVCGQAQRSIKWMENIDEIFKHLGRRSSDRKKLNGVDRFELGNEEQLDLLRRRARKDLKVKMNIFIAQPGLSFGDYDENSEISKLLAVVETYLKETWNADLKVITSE